RFSRHCRCAQFARERHSVGPRSKVEDSHLHDHESTVTTRKSGAPKTDHSKKRRGEPEKLDSGLPVSRSQRRGTGVPPVALSFQKSPIITLLTDFGTSDYFVAAMKGVILSINPAARI